MTAAFTARARIGPRTYGCERVKRARGDGCARGIPSSTASVGSNANVTGRTRVTVSPDVRGGGGEEAIYPGPGIFMGMRIDKPKKKSGFTEF